MYKQICFVAQQTAHHLIEDYTKEEIDQKARLRRVDMKLPLKKKKEVLEDLLTRELYILDVTNLTLWSPDELHPLAVKLKIDPNDFPDTIHLAWMIAMMIVRDHVPYHFTTKRKIQLVTKHKVKVETKTETTT